jgi:hypothetical protein
MKKNIYFFTVVFLAFILTACKVRVGSELFATDIYSNDNIRTPASMMVEIPSCSGDSRQKYDDSLLALFDSASEAKIIGCDRESMNSFLNISFKAEIATGSSNADLIFFRENLDDGEIKARGIKPVLSDSFLNRVKTLSDKSMNRIKYDDFVFEVNLNNDEKDSVYISAYDLWVNGEPYESYKQ